MGGTDWTCFDMKDTNSLYFDSFSCPPENVLLQQLPKPIPSPNYEIQHIES